MGKGWVSGKFLFQPACLRFNGNPMMVVNVSGAAELARRSQALIQEFTGGDAGIERSLNQMYQQEGADVASRGAMDSALMEYMSKARAALNQSE